MWRCPECGITNVTDRICNYCGKSAPAGATLEPVCADWTLLQWIGYLRLVLVAFVCIGIGIAILVQPDPEWKPGLFLVGGGVLLLAIFSLPLMRR